jgi:hypothetical protein
MTKNFEIKTTFSAADKASRVIGGIQAKVAKFSAKASMHLRKVDRFTRKLSSTLTSVLKVGAVAGAGALGLVFHAVNRTAESMDALAKKTRAMSFPIETYQEYRFAAEQSGVSTEMFDKSLQKFTKTVGELKGGYGAMYTALKKTNPALLKQLKNTDNVGVAFYKYLQAIEKTPGAMDKAALATAGFGRSGMDMINLADAGAEEIEKLRKQMRENGIVTAEQAAKAEAYNDMMNRVKLTVSGFMVDVLTPLMPKLTSVADATRKWMVENRGLIKSKVSAFFEKLPSMFKQFSDSMRGVVPLLSKAVAQIKSLAVWIAKVDWGKWLPIITKAIALFYGMRIAVKTATVSMNLFNAAMNLNLGPARKASAFFAKEMPAAMGKSIGAAGKLQSTLGVLSAAVAGWGIGTVLYEKLVDPLIEAQARLQEYINDVSDTMGRDVSKRSPAQLRKDIAAVDKTNRALKNDAVLNYLPGMGFFQDMGKLGLQKERERLMGALNTAENKRKYAVNQTFGDVAPWEAPLPTSAAPAVTTSTHESVSKSQVEVTIKDETGRARVTKDRRRGSGAGLKLVHTGTVK